MPAVTNTSGRPVPDQWYAEIQAFYAGHVRHRDEGSVDGWLAAIDEDAQVVTNVFTAGGAALAESMRQLDAQFARAGLQRRHHLSTFVALLQPDDTVITRYYALVITTPPGGGPSAHSTSVVRDVLARTEHGEWRVRDREIIRDDLLQRPDLPAQAGFQPSSRTGLKD